MGYYTKHKLTVNPPDQYQDVYEAYLTHVGEHHDNIFTSESKWYTEMNDSKVISAQFPDVVISISGQGEDEDDLWRRDYYRGNLVSEWEFSGIPNLTQQEIDNIKLSN